MITLKGNQPEALSSIDPKSTSDAGQLNANEPLPKKTMLRRRSAVVSPSSEAANPTKTFESNEPRPTTAHDRYLTYDSKGKLITHTVYFGPPPTKPVVLTFPNSKKYKLSKSKGESS
jgi:hypothetical protein